jgi:hypothetical protein
VGDRVATVASRFADLRGRHFHCGCRANRPCRFRPGAVVRRAQKGRHFIGCPPQRERRASPPRGPAGGASGDSSEGPQEGPRQPARDQQFRRGGRQVARSASIVGSLLARPRDGTEGQAALHQGRRIRPGRRRGAQGIAPAVPGPVIAIAVFLVDRRGYCRSLILFHVTGTGSMSPVRGRLFRDQAPSRVVEAHRANLTARGDDPFVRATS